LTTDEIVQPHPHESLGKRRRSSNNDDGDDTYDGDDDYDVTSDGISNVTRKSPRKRARKEVKGTNAPEQRATATSNQQKAWPIARMETKFTEDGTLSYTNHWEPTTYVCNSLKHLKKYEREMLEAKVIAEHGQEKWDLFLQSQE
jgi:hypothetical protein